MSEFLHEGLFKVLFDHVMDGQVTEWIRILFLEDMIHAFAAEQVGNEHAVVAVEEYVDEEGLFLFELDHADLAAAARAVITVIEPPRFESGSVLYFRLQAHLVQKVEDLVFGHMG